MKYKEIVNIIQTVDDATPKRMKQRYQVACAISLVDALLDSQSSKMNVVGIGAVLATSFVSHTLAGCVGCGVVAIEVNKHGIRKSIRRSLRPRKLMVTLLSTVIIYT